MAKVKLVADEPRQVSILPAGALRLVEPGEVFDVPDDVADAYACQPHYFDVQPAKKAAAKKVD